MQTDNSLSAEAKLNSNLSFRPLVMFLKKNIEEGNPGMSKLYGQVVEEFESHPELLETITDLNDLRPHSELIEELLSAVFPPTTSNYMYGVSIPFRPEAVYVSPLFKKLLLKPRSNIIDIPEFDLNSSFSLQHLQFAYGLILKKYFGLDSPQTYRSVYTNPDTETGLMRYMELRVDGRFIEIKPVSELPNLPESIIDSHTNRLMNIAELIQHIPIDKFVFEGLFVLRINDMTDQEVITKIKNRFLDHSAFSDSSIYNELEEQVQCLIGMKDVSIGITPFFKINNHYVYSDLHNMNSILFRHFKSITDKDEISDYCKLLFRDNDKPLLFETLTEQAINEVQSLQYYHLEGGRSLILCPLKVKNDLIGMLEIISEIPGLLKPQHISKIEPAVPLFTLGLEKSLEQLNFHVDRVIKNKFTAVQPSVEWKFTEAALNYIVNQTSKEDAKIERIAFNEVYPLYSAIDIRNSSTERSHSIQQDIIEQLELALKVVKKAQAEISFPLLQEIEFKINKHIMAASDVLQSEEEMNINEFFHKDITSVFDHLRSAEPSLKNIVEDYYGILDPQLGMLYKHRKNYESSVTKINETLARFIDKEQLSAQKVYPHFFERYVTDGLEFNIYMGQSITPRKKFDEIYLRNLRMWQLTVLAKASRLTHKLESDLTIPLRTTQLILSHNQALAILFRTEERKFDVDGAQNVRYEIIKKRIDKVRIKDTNERLTQPGKIAIVYTQHHDAEEYTEYIEFLQNKNLLKPGIEHHDLEELQGVSGLKALRVDVNFDDLPVAKKKAELSATTS